MEIERPLDFLNQKRGKFVLIRLKDQTEVEGFLVAFDIYINLVVKDAKAYSMNDDLIKSEMIFIKGDNVISVM